MFCSVEVDSVMCHLFWWAFFLSHEQLKQEIRMTDVDIAVK